MKKFKGVFSAVCVFAVSFLWLRLPGTVFAACPLAEIPSVDFRGAVISNGIPSHADEIVIWCADEGRADSNADIEAWIAALRMSVANIRRAVPRARIAIGEPFSSPRSGDGRLMRLQGAAAKAAAEAGLPLVKRQRLANGDVGDANGGVFSWSIPQNTALVPRAKLETDSYDWYARHAAVLAREAYLAERLGPDKAVVFIGDSITHFWAGAYTTGGDDALERWKKNFGTETLNAGFGWDRIQNVLWRLDHGLLDRLEPRIVVLAIGSNNIGGTSNARANTPEEISEGVRAVAMRIREKAPRAKIVVANILPRGERPGEIWRRVGISANALVKKWASAEVNTVFLEAYEAFIGKDGLISRDIMFDFTHPSDKGYELWAGFIKPLLR